MQEWRYIDNENLTDGVSIYNLRTGRTSPVATGAFALENASTPKPRGGATRVYEDWKPGEKEAWEKQWQELQLSYLDPTSPNYRPPFGYDPTRPPGPLKLVPTPTPTPAPGLGKDTPPPTGRSANDPADQRTYAYLIIAFVLLLILFRK